MHQELAHQESSNPSPTTSSINLSWHDDEFTRAKISFRAQGLSEFREVALDL